jgi:hypothetical protein
MRIISKFKDYYDGLMDHSKDRLNRVWVRNTESLELPLSKIKNLDKSTIYWGWQYSLYYAVVSGKVYPFIKYDAGGTYPQKVTYYYSLEEFDKDHPKVTSGRHKRWIDFFSTKPDLTDLCMELESPVLIVTKYGNEFVVIKNPRLKDIEFYKQMDIYSVYQEIDMFMSNVMVSDKMPMSPMTDIEKVESHGFDKNISFRKQKVAG